MATTKATLVRRTAGEHLGRERWTVSVRNGAQSFLVSAWFESGALVEAHDIDKRPVNPSVLVAIQKAWKGP